MKKMQINEKHFHKKSGVSMKNTASEIFFLIFITSSS